MFVAMVHFYILWPESLFLIFCEARIWKWINRYSPQKMFLLQTLLFSLNQLTKNFRLRKSDSVNNPATGPALTLYYLFFPDNQPLLKYYPFKETTLISWTVIFYRVGSNYIFDVGAFLRVHIRSSGFSTLRIRKFIYTISFVFTVILDLG